MRVRESEHSVAENPKGRFLYYRNIEAPDCELSGIDRKVLTQIKAFNDARLTCKLEYCAKPESFLRKALSCLPFVSDGVKWPEVSDIGSADFIYIRRPVYASSGFRRFLRKLRAANPDVKVIYEIPTYPYDAEYAPLSLRPALIKDRFHRRRLKGLVDRIADLSGQSEIFGIQTVPFANGVDLTCLSARKVSAIDPSIINIMCAASYTPSHGIDRMIEGLRIYKEGQPSRRVVLHLAGGGPEIPNLKSMVSQYGLEDDVVFHGVLDSNGLDRLYDQCSLAIAVLGLHRVGIEVSSGLKIREYLAKGMPFVYSGKIDLFEDEPLELCLELPDDESPVDVASLVAFHDRIYSEGDQTHVIDEIRNYAERKVSITEAMGDIFAYIESGASNCPKRKDSTVL